MSSRYDLESLKELNRQELKTESTEELLMKIIALQHQILEQLDSEDTMMLQERYLRVYLSEQKKTAEQVEMLKLQLPKLSAELMKQAGKMSEQYSLLTKKTESYRTRIKEKQLKLVLLSQSALLVLSALFQPLLR